jgi:hypothetical protein
MFRPKVDHGHARERLLAHARVQLSNILLTGWFLS